MPNTFLTATIVEEHKVSSVETLQSIAGDCGMSWQELAQFNWNTSSPPEINRNLAEVVGCTKKTKNGKNYIFDDSDEPGILYVPVKDWKQSGLAVDCTHTIRVLRVRNLILRLEDTDGHPIPETSYEIVFDDDSHRSGRLGRGGAGLIRNVPEGAFAVYYTDHHDILAKSLAACVKDAVGASTTEEIFRLLQHPPEIINAAVSAYEEYYNDYSGKGLIEDIYSTVTDEKVLTAVEGLMAYVGLPTRENIVIAQRLEL